MARAEIEPIVPRKIEIPDDGLTLPGDLFSLHLGDRGFGLNSEYGWPFYAGDPPWWKFQDRLLVPDGKALDIGTGLGRSALPFALRGMNVVGYENGPTYVTLLSRLLDSYDFLPIELRDEDFTKADFGKEEYDTAIMAQSFDHLASFEDVETVIRKAVKALKPGGHIYIRALGSMDSSYDELAMLLGEDLGKPRGRKGFMSPHHHHGPDHDHHSGFTPVLFFSQIDLMKIALEEDMKIVYSRTIPTQNVRNYMFGEDDHPEDQPLSGGTITLVAQKPAS